MKYKLFITVILTLATVALVVFLLQIGLRSVEQETQIPTQSSQQPTENHAESVTYQCADQKTVTITAIVNDSAHRLITPSGESVVVREQLASLGTRFENLDGNIIWQSSDGEAFLQELGVLTATECVVEKRSTTETSQPTRNQLAETSWEWHSVEYANDELFVPEQPELFILNFTNKTVVSALTDCNSLRGTYRLGDKQRIEFANLSSTRMFCEGSQEGIFQEVLQETEGWRRVNDQLQLILADGLGTSTFSIADVVVQ